MSLVPVCPRSIDICINNVDLTSGTEWRHTSSGNNGKWGMAKSCWTSKLLPTQHKCGASTCQKSNEFSLQMVAFLRSTSQESNYIFREGESASLATRKRLTVHTGCNYRDLFTFIWILCHETQRQNNLDVFPREMAEAAWGSCARFPLVEIKVSVLCRWLPGLQKTFRRGKT